ncbi:hypothetical protein IKE87_00985 [Candidatus Saccharibacteria bacterium]|nr:hypothetical protein [Candidatus Saccharibacteria bacterium]
MKIKRVLLVIMGISLMVMWGCGFGGKIERALAENQEDSSIWNPPEYYIKAVNPGYKIDGISNVGEMIEIGRKKTDEMSSLAGLELGYTNSSGNYAIIYEFPENGFMVGETILLNLAGSSGAGLAALEYTKTLAMSGGLSLVRGEEILDTVCWTGKDGCEKAFNSAKPTILVRNLETGEWEHRDDYETGFRVEDYYEVPEESGKGGEGMGTSHCVGMEFSEILSYYESAKTEQFIEFYNPTAEQISLDGCNVRYKNKNYAVMGVVEAEGYFVYYPAEFNLTKNPTNVNTIELVEADGTKVDKMEYRNGQRKGAAYAHIGYDKEGAEIWKVTYAPTPGAANNYQEYKTCEDGKVINPVTGNCVKVTEVSEKTCKEGYFLNILTGRCNKIPLATEKTCKEGYYLNPETNRCKKKQDNDGAKYGLAEEKYEENSSFVGLIAVIIVIMVGLGYLIYEFRDNIRKTIKKWMGRK